MAAGNGATPERHERWMRAALAEAEKAFEAEETPIGAVVVSGERIVGRGHNQSVTLSDPTAHAEMIAITAAAETIGDWRLIDCDLYCTVEPCVMCAGAAVLGRIRGIYYGTPEPKFGGCGSVFNVTAEDKLNHQIHVTGGILAEESASLMQKFFQKLRAGKRAKL